IRSTPFLKSITNRPYTAVFRADPSLSTRTTMKKIFLTVLLIVSSASVARAEPPSIDGRIYDLRGYVMHGLTVRAINKATGAEYKTICDDTARFACGSLERGRFVLGWECRGLKKFLGSADVTAGETLQIELLAMPLTQTGNTAVDKHIASMSEQGGNYPG